MALEDPYDPQDPQDPLTAPARDRNALRSRAKSLYGNSWDADAEQQFNSRFDQNQSDEDLLAHTGEDYRARFPSGGGAAPQGTSQYSSGQAGSGDAALSSFMDYIKTRDSASQQQQAALREILMGQLGQATSPLDANAPGIREVLAGQRLGLQRGAERKLADSAELRAYDGSGGVGGKAYTQDRDRILQGQAESDAQMTGDVLNRELQQKRDQVTRMLALATQLGDAESARLLQAQLNSIQTQLSQSNFYDQSAFNYAQLNQQGNQNTLLSLLGALS
jgi:hypothetical protein